ncbi:epoxide hydrolase family protein [Lentzea sp. NPDC051838]|uniref:epoxide hydrolase family protein n=1 Tax=Lentzea sp. NPDC051838 TaxID=3154849 RepID=UPI00342433C9
MSGPTRRQLLQGGLAAGLSVAVTSALGEAPAFASRDGIRPFRVAVPRRQLADLRDRVAATRWPSRELVADRTQGVQLAAAQGLARFWTTRYDWRRFEEKINAFPQFKTEIDGVDIHFVHVRSKHSNALPLIMTHGWPGSIVELLETIGPLTNPTAHGGTAADAFHVVLPSIPGYGFSAQPTGLGWETGRTARAWAELMRRLGYTRYVAQGGDVGAAVTDNLGRLAPAGLAGIHLNLLVPALRNSAGLPKNTDEEKAAAAALKVFGTTGNGYLVEQSTRPETIGYALLDSPVALAAWMLDHDTDSYHKIARAFLGEAPAGNLTREHVLDNISLYWLTGTGVSAARAYWESFHSGGQVTAPVKVPVAFSAFPGEIFQAPRSWVQSSYPTLSYYQQPVRGGHFAAWEEPGLFTAELRAAFRSLR